MSALKIAGLLILSLAGSVAVAQNNPQEAQSTREFLRSVDPQKRAELVRRNPLKMAKNEYFAKSGRFDVYEFDISVLEPESQTVTITPFGGPPIDIISHGIERDEETGWFLGKWSGEIVPQNGRQTYPIQLRIVTWAIGQDGKLRTPDSNREVEVTLGPLENENSVVLTESAARPDEKLVYAISGSIRLPHLGRQITLAQMDEDLESLIMYEVDPEKTIPAANDIDSELELEDAEIRADRLRRTNAFNAYMERRRQELAEKNNP